MDVTINGEKRTLAGALTVSELLAELGLGAGPVAVEINREIVPRARHASHAVGEGDAIEIVHLVGGG